jgi:CelD/BcsL family acetyltransferase involved in cellulose biosynthesis
MIIEQIKDFDVFLNLEKDWNRIVKNSAHNTIFYRHEWFRCWWRAYGKNKQLFIVTIREGEELICLAPLMITKGKFRSLPVWKVEFIENDESPRCDFILSQEKDRLKLIKSIVEFLLKSNQSWDLVFLRKIPKDSKTCKYLMNICSNEGLRVCMNQSLKSPFLRIACDWETFYKSTSQRFKKRIRSNRNRLKRLGAISFENYTGQKSMEQVLPEIFAVGKKSWKEKINKSISSTDQNRIFFSKIYTETSSNKWPSVWLLKVNDNAVAFEFHLHYEGEIHALRSEFNETYREYSPGSVLESYIVENIFRNGLKSYDMGGSADNYKTRWTKSFREHTDMIIFRKGFYPKFLSLIEKQLIPYIKRKKSIYDAIRILKKQRIQR